MNKRNTRSVLFIFVDGIGIGPRNSKINPLSAFPGEVLKFFTDQPCLLPHNGRLVPTDARLETAGLPQSATGQTTLFTGVNAAQRIGRHLQGFPSPRLKEVIAEESLFKKLKKEGLKPTFANVYTPRFFNDRPRWISVTTTMCESAGVRLRRLEDLKNCQGLFMDYTNRFLKRKGMDLREYSPEEAAQILIDLSNNFDLVLYEYFLTDYVGHRGKFDEAVSLLKDLDRFLSHLVKLADLDSTSVILTSDHGNIEDFTTNLHTLNPVPTCLWGKLKNKFLDPALALTDITPRLINFLSP